ncbi:hypothetical protein EYF80_019402 [Liparis tanakae]|uniref:Uncharacterized protein n=1 Tax=Liparis tanakae TaxID=230148 RepID=A0A4Z2HWZ2_9TELE|nr:hypothetical protein EYF80_019402 [Liparis tanakae]
MKDTNTRPDTAGAPSASTQPAPSQHPASTQPAPSQHPATRTATAWRQHETTGTRTALLLQDKATAHVGSQITMTTLSKSHVDTALDEAPYQRAQCNGYLAKQLTQSPLSLTPCLATVTLLD